MSGLLMHPPSCGQHTQSGFSLIELIIVISILAIMVAIAAPNVTASMDNQRNKQAVEMLKSAFREARTESQLRRQDVEVSLVGNTITLTVPTIDASGKKTGTTTLKEFSSNKKATITPTSATITFKSNKSVIDPKKAKETTFSYEIVCNKDSRKKGSKVVVNNHGNVSIDNGANKC